MSVTCLFQQDIRFSTTYIIIWTKTYLFNTFCVYFAKKKKKKKKHFHQITAPHLNKKIAIGHRNLAGEFYVLAGEFSDLWHLMNTLIIMVVNCPQKVRMSRPGLCYSRMSCLILQLNKKVVIISSLKKIVLEFFKLRSLTKGFYLGWDVLRHQQNTLGSITQTTNTN